MVRPRPTGFPKLGVVRSQPPPKARPRRVAVPPPCFSMGRPARVVEAYLEREARRLASSTLTRPDPFPNAAYCTGNFVPF